MLVCLRGWLVAYGFGVEVSSSSWTLMKEKCHDESWTISLKGIFDTAKWI